jgi:hypothetical protein
MTISNETPGWTSGHIYGQCSVNHTRKLFYVKIPKCASSWTDYYIAQLGTTVRDTWVGGNFLTDDLTAYQPIIMLRDPVERWISHCPMKGKVAEGIVTADLESRMIDEITNAAIDEHTCPQTKFVKGLDTARAIFFYVASTEATTLSARFQDFLNKQQFTTIEMPARINESIADKETVSAKANWKEFLADPVNRRIFQEMFQDDYNLIESVNFYNINGE